MPRTSCQKTLYNLRNGWSSVRVVGGISPLMTFVVWEASYRRLEQMVWPK